MAGWQASIEEPIHYDYGRYRVQKCGPWAQGLLTLQQLAILAGFGLDGADPTGTDFIHLVVEASKLAFAAQMVIPLKASSLVSAFSG